LFINVARTARQLKKNIRDHVESRILKLKVYIDASTHPWMWKDRILWLLLHAKSKRIPREMPVLSFRNNILSVIIYREMAADDIASFEKLARSWWSMSNNLLSHYISITICAASVRLHFRMVYRFIKFVKKIETMHVTTLRTMITALLEYENNNKRFLKQQQH
jgi:hypothetical protein